MTSLFDLTSKVAVVTGSGRGLGRALAGGLAAHGAAVVVCDRDENGAVRVADDLVASGYRSVGSRVDVADYSSCEALVALTLRHFGRLDILVNNAAIDIIEPVDRITPEHRAAVLSVDLTGAFYCAQLAARQMGTQDTGGSIVNISSIAGAVGIPRSPSE